MGGEERKVMLRRRAAAEDGVAQDTVQGRNTEGDAEICKGFLRPTPPAGQENQRRPQDQNERRPLGQLCGVLCVEMCKHNYNSSLLFVGIQGLFSQKVSLSDRPLSDREF